MPVTVPGMLVEESSLHEAKDLGSSSPGLRAAATVDRESEDRPPGSKTSVVSVPETGGREAPEPPAEAPEGSPEMPSDGPVQLVASPGKGGEKQLQSVNGCTASEERVLAWECNEVGYERDSGTLNVPEVVDRFSSKVSSTGSAASDFFRQHSGSEDEPRSSSRNRNASKLSVCSRQDILLSASTANYRRSIIDTIEEQHTMWSRDSIRMTVRYCIAIAQKYSIPLVLGVCIALIWTNIDEQSYHDFTHQSLGGKVFGHEVTVHFVVNDIFMCFFFGLAVKEVTEALLPGGALSPWRRAVNPLMATLGGVFGPIAVYALSIYVFYESNMFASTDCSLGAGGSGGHRRLDGGDSGLVSASGSSSAIHASGAHKDCGLSELLNGWGVPTATDISLAWMFSLLIFGVGHSAINFMLLLAILDDAIGMVIIAVFYPDPDNPVDAKWLACVVGAALLALLMRKAKVGLWPFYVFICGPISWIGFLKSHVHPALALVLIVPCMPATHALAVDDDDVCNLGACDLGPAAAEETEKSDKRAVGSQASLFTQEDENEKELTDSRTSRISGVFKKLQRSNTSVSLGKLSTVVHEYLQAEEAEAPLHVFEAQVKRPVDFGMFFFGLANAGVAVDVVGGVTWAVIIALVVGKTVGITLFSLLAVALGFGLPEGLAYGDLVAMSALAGVGLTVALFLANEAFKPPQLVTEAKMGAVLSVAAGLVAYLIRRVFGSNRSDCSLEEAILTRRTSSLQHD